MVINDMSVKSIVMPYFFVLVIFQIFFKQLDNIFVLGVIVYKKTGPTAEIDVRTAKGGRTDDFAFIDGGLYFWVDIYGFCVPTHYAFRVFF